MKKLFAILLAAALLCTCTACGGANQPDDTQTTTTAATTQPTAAPVDYSAFAAKYSDTDTVEGPCYTVNITAVDTAAKTIEFTVSYLGANSSPIYDTDAIQATIADDHTVTFDWKDSWQNEGNGTLKLNPDDTSTVQILMNVTTEAEVNRATLSTHDEYKTLTRR